MRRHVLTSSTSARWVNRPERAAAARRRLVRGRRPTPGRLDIAEPRRRRVHHADTKKNPINRATCLSGNLGGPNDGTGPAGRRRPRGGERRAQGFHLSLDSTRGLRKCGARLGAGDETSRSNARSRAQLHSSPLPDGRPLLLQRAGTRLGATRAGGPPSPPSPPPQLPVSSQADPSRASWSSSRKRDTSPGRTRTTDDAKASLVAAGSRPAAACWK